MKQTQFTIKTSNRYKINKIYKFIEDNNLDNTSFVVDKYDQKVTELFLLEKCSEFFNIPKSILLKKTRKADVIQARQFFYHTMRTTTNLSFYKIGRFFGQSHCNVINSNKKFKQYYEFDKQYKRKYDEFEQFLNLK